MRIKNSNSRSTSIFKYSSINDNVTLGKVIPKVMSTVTATGYNCDVV